MEHLTPLLSDLPINEENGDRQWSSINQENERSIHDDPVLSGEYVLIARTSAFIEQQTKTFDKILQAPFILLAICAGFWPIRPRGLQFFLAVVGVVINIYILFGDIFVYKICDELPHKLADNLSPWLCYGMASFNRSSKAFAEILRPVLFTRTAFAFARFWGYVLMVYSVFLTLRTREIKVITLSEAMCLLTRNQWIRLNLQLLLSFVIWLVYLISAIKFAQEYISYYHEVVPMIIDRSTMWFYTGTPCWIFAVIIYALESLIKTCYKEIEQLDNGTVEDVIAIYRQLCKNTFNTVSALRFWFVIHWINFAALSVIDVAVGFKAVEIQFVKRKNGVLFWVFTTAFASFVLHPFLYPSLRAASLTSTNEDMLERLNFMKWCDEHPLKRRRDMNEFLLFAKQARCGFRIGRLTFNNGLAWLSVFLGIFGLAIKLM